LNDVKFEAFLAAPAPPAASTEDIRRSVSSTISGAVVRDATILSAIGVGPDSRRSLLGVSVALSEAEVHRRAFLDSLVMRGIRAVQFITSDDHAGLGAARRAVFGGVTWQRCQFHLAQNAIHHAPSHAIRSVIGAELHAVWNAKDITAANEELRLLVQRYAKTAPDGSNAIFRKAWPCSACRIRIG
jgi:putative transposase